MHSDNNRISNSKDLSLISKVTTFSKQVMFQKIYQNKCSHQLKFLRYKKSEKKYFQGAGPRDFFFNNYIISKHNPNFYRYFSQPYYDNQNQPNQNSDYETEDHAYSENSFENNNILMTFLMTRMTNLFRTLIKMKIFT